jgi:hypothetical protein
LCLFLDHVLKEGDEMRSRKGLVNLNWAFLCLAVTLLPITSTGVATDLADHIAESFGTVFDGLLGTELGMQFPFDFGNYGQFDFVLIGFAFCDPPDHWADPDPDPIGSLNAYGCENVTDVDVAVTPGEDEATVQITISDFFIDFETTRPALLVPCGELGDDPVTAEGWALLSTTIEATFELAFEGGCFNVIIVPGSLSATSTVKDFGTRDQCLEDNWWLVEEAFTSALEDGLNQAFEDGIVEWIGDINALLCMFTPTMNSSWGSVKSAYR